MQSQDIYNKSDIKSKNKAENQNIKARLYKVDGNKVIYTVESSEHNKNYLVTIQLLNLDSSKLDSISNALNGDLKINCTCPAFLFRGYKYISWKSNVGIEPETRAPDITNPDRKGLVCKHILVALEQMKSDYNAIYNKIKRQLPNKEATQSDIKGNKSSDSFNELDLKILDDFKSKCDKLYSAYIKYLNSDLENDVEFLDSEFYDGNDPSTVIASLSKAASNLLKGRFIGRLKSLKDILNIIKSKKNGFNVLLNSDLSYLIKKINSLLKTKTESLLNDIILSLLDYT